VIFEAAEALRLHETEELCITHHADQFGGDMTPLFRLKGLLAGDDANRAGPLDKLRHARFCRASHSYVLDCADGHATTSTVESRSSDPKRVSAYLCKYLAVARSSWRLCCLWTSPGKIIYLHLQIMSRR